MTLQVIGLSGKAGAGKDFISQNILRRVGYTQWSLSWHFKMSIVGKGLGSFDDVFIHKPPHIRHELQQEGTERGRLMYGEDVWCKTAHAWFTVLNQHCGINKFVLSDIRFPNEVNFVKSMGGKVFRIHAPIRVNNSPLTAAARLHESETALDHYSDDMFDGIINNDPEYGDTLTQQVCTLVHFAF